jgi:ABC-type transporter Mla subunit MlaD
MTRQAQVGAFAILALLLLFGVFYVVTDFGTRHTGYRIGVHFQSAAGLHSGALVYFSGVTVGTVDSITLLPDNTVDVILAINRDVDIPSISRFLIQAPLTGDPNMIIVPPILKKGGSPVGPPLARMVLPVDQQPQGANNASVADLLEQGQGEVRRLDAILSQLEAREPKLLDTLESTLVNANQLTSTVNHSMGHITSTLNTTLDVASRNIVELTGTLNDSAGIDTKRLDAILVQFQGASVALNESMQSVRQLATDKEVKANLIATTKNIADTTETIAELTRDFRTVTSDPQTQQQIKNTIANLDATMQKANSLLGELGGQSSVYGVDQGATPAPVPTSNGSPIPAGPLVPGATPYPTISPIPVSTMNPSGTASSKHALTPTALNDTLKKIARNLIAIQLRVSELDTQTVCCANPLLSADRGPEVDLNAILFPRSPTSLMVGGNNIGYDATTNIAVLQSVGPQIRVGGGLLYSSLGVLGQYNARLFGVETRIYNQRRPSIDLYGNINVFKNAYLFVGQRDMNHNTRRFTYGLQLQVP